MASSRRFRFLLLALCICAVVLLSPATTHAYSIVWGNQEGGEPQQIEIQDDGTYAPPLNIPAEAYIEPPPDASFFDLYAEVYRVDKSGSSPVREHIATIYTHRDWDDDEIFAWPASGSYEADVYEVPPPVVSIRDAFMRILTRTLHTPLVYADSHEPMLITTLHFTIGEVDTVPDPVIIIPGILGSEEQNGEWVIDPILHTYDDLIATLDANGYTPGVDLFTFPYNWRLSNVHSATLLKEKIDTVKGVCACDKVDLVAHSMGGLIARQYIQSDTYENDVDQLIFLGTPHLGAPKAYLMWEGGEVGPSSEPLDTLTEIVLRHEGYEYGFPHLFDYVRTVPIESVRELLPIYDYIFDDSVLRDYPNNYPRNIFLENLNSGKNDFLNSGIEIHNIVGHGGADQTIIGINATDPGSYLPKWFHGYPNNFYNLLGDHGLVVGQGDRTVPFVSASHINQNLQIINSTHGTIPDNSAGKVFKILTDMEPSLIIDDFDLINAKLLILKILSPADLLVIAPDGKKIGKDFDGEEVNEILNAFYTGFGDDSEFITILNPLDGEYKIYSQGTGSGPYTVEVAYLEDEQRTEASFTGNTFVGLTTEIITTLDLSAPEKLDLIPADTEPPDITIHQPTPGTYTRATLPVEVTAEDAGSGVFALEVFLDDEPVENPGNIDLFFKPLGVHTITASSTDNVGNAAVEEITLTTVATPRSLLADLERAYALGWITKHAYLPLSKAWGARIKVSEKIQQPIAERTWHVMLKELNIRRGRGVNEQAYWLLREDIEWIIANN